MHFRVNELPELLLVVSNMLEEAPDVHLEFLGALPPLRAYFETLTFARLNYDS